MTVGKKLVLSFGALLALVAGLAYSSFFSIHVLSETLDKALNSTARKTGTAAQIVADVEQMRSGQRGMILFSMLKNPAEVPARASFQSAMSEIRRQINDMRPLIATARPWPPSNHN